MDYFKIQQEFVDIYKTITMENKKETFLELHESLLRGDERPLTEKEMVRARAFMFPRDKKRLWNGLCYVEMNGKYLTKNELFIMMMPDKDDRFGNNPHEGWWADIDLDLDSGRNYNHMRQNIILLCAALNNEL